MSDFNIKARNLFIKIDAKLQKNLEKNQNNQKSETIFDSSKSSSSSDDDIYGGILKFRRNTNSETNQTTQNNQTSQNSESVTDSFVFKYTKYITPDSTTETTTNDISKSDEMLIIKANKEKEAKEAEEQTDSSKTTETSGTNAAKKETYLKYSEELSEILEDYEEKISNRLYKLVLPLTDSSSETTTKTLTYYNLIENADKIGEYRVTDKDGNIVVSSADEIPENATQKDGAYYSDDGKKYVVLSDLSDTDYFQKALRNGEIILQKPVTEENKTTWIDTDCALQTFIQDALYTEDDAAAEAEYKEKMKALSENDEYKEVLKEYDTVVEKYIDNDKVKELEEKYNEKLENRKLKFIYSKSGSSEETQSEDLSYFSLMNNNSSIGEHRVVDKSGNILVPNSDYIPETATKIGNNYYSSDGKKYVIMEELSNQTDFQTALREGEILLQKTVTENEETTWSDVDYTTLSYIQDVLYAEDDAQAEEEYEYELQKLKDEAYFKYLDEQG
ncbi:hypothetical protein IJS77_05790 [bacterium]|nr:hypothetical protein [bacterium]